MSHTNPPYTPGPKRDPIRQQGFGLTKSEYQTQQWFESKDPRDYSRAAGARRVYHVSYMVRGGVTFDEACDEMSRIASELEEAGIDLGWGGVRSRSWSMESTPQRERDRRYSGGEASEYQKKFRTAVSNSAVAV